MAVGHHSNRFLQSIDIVTMTDASQLLRLALEKGITFPTESKGASQFVNWTCLDLPLKFNSEQSEDGESRFIARHDMAYGFVVNSQ